MQVVSVNGREDVEVAMSQPATPMTVQIITYVPTRFQH